MAVLQVNGLEKIYKTKDKKLIAVNGLDFKVEEGELLGLLGPNGAGKTTTISMISNLIKPTKGEIIYKDNNIITDPTLIQKELGYVPQDIALYTTLTAYDNLLFFGKLYNLKGKMLRERIEHILDIIGLTDRKKDKVETFSGGMKRRLNIGAALLHRPSFFIMDEPTVGIDPQSRNYILEIVKTLNKEGTTVIYTSHYMEEVEYLCSRICIMDQGKIIADGTKEQLLRSISEGERVYLKVDNNHDKVMREIKALSFVKEVKQVENQILIKTEKDVGNSHQIITTLTKTDVKIISLEIKKPSLETVFLSLTGKTLRD